MFKGGDSERGAGARSGSGRRGRGDNVILFLRKFGNARGCTIRHGVRNPERVGGGGGAALFLNKVWTCKDSVREEGIKTQFVTDGFKWMGRRCFLLRKFVKCKGLLGEI